MENIVDMIEKKKTVPIRILPSLHMKIRILQATGKIGSFQEICVKALEAAAEKKD